MPRKRHTKIVNRIKPQLPDDSMVEAHMDESSRNSKLDLLLWDFDKGVAEYIKKMETALAETIASIERMYKVEMMKIPPAQLNMLWEAYIQFNASEHLPLSVAVNDIINACPSQSCVIEVDKELVKPRKKRGRPGKQKQTDLQVIIPENSCDENNYNSVVTSTVTRSKRIQASLASTVGQSATLHSWTKSSVDDKCGNNIEPIMATEPRNRRGARGMKYMTPAVTPKWDLRTPATLSRYARPGELLMSLEGSPITVRTANSVKELNAMVPLPNGMTLAINENTDMKSIPYPELDHSTRVKVMKLKENISALLLSSSHSN